MKTTRWKSLTAVAVLGAAMAFASPAFAHHRHHHHHHHGHHDNGPPPGR